MPFSISLSNIKLIWIYFFQADWYVNQLMHFTHPTRSRDVTLTHPSWNRFKSLSDLRLSALRHLNAPVLWYIGKMLVKTYTFYPFIKLWSLLNDWSRKSIDDFIFNLQLASSIGAKDKSITAPVVWVKYSEFAIMVAHNRIKYGSTIQAIRHVEGSRNGRMAHIITNKVTVIIYTPTRARHTVLKVLLYISMKKVSSTAKKRNTKY